MCSLATLVNSLVKCLFTLAHLSLLLLLLICGISLYTLGLSPLLVMDVGNITFHSLAYACS